ncbi:RNA-binding protein [Penicillium argentinense]|uniref:RNA-binding protein n=1 Tax=Penicillium argentinense TaxID=1131581 RepID=A0A9W9KKL3_9EURO|nr:RNA-binding protein [Penicillium argentinense]KAJ5109755.1 RNA-binding protein [Penicillium argentinense]
MSFNNFDSFPNQGDAAAAAPAPGADTTMTGQADPATAPFQGPAPGEPAAAPVPQQGNEGKTTLWMGELEPWIDENFIRNLWFQMGEQVNVKMIRDKFSGSNAGYCFVDFASPAAAAKALSLNGTPMPNTNRVFKLNWATGGGLADRRCVRRKYKHKHARKHSHPVPFEHIPYPQLSHTPITPITQPHSPKSHDQDMPDAPMLDAPVFNAPGYSPPASSDPLVYPVDAHYTWYPNYYGPQHLTNPSSRDDRGPEYSIFVGDLGPEVNEYVLVSLFQSRFPSCKSAKIMTDPISGMSRGYGFVRFSDENDQQRALTEMQGVYCGNRPMRISTATPKNKGPGVGANNMGMGPGPAGMYPPMGGPPMPFYGAPQPMNQFTDPNNTTVFVGGLSGYVTEDELRSFFQGFGEITYVKIPPGKGCGFVQFVQRHAAEMAINQMQGYPIGNSRVRLSWGRSQNNSGPAGSPYRPAPPPPPMYPSMGMPPAQYGGFAPMKVSSHPGSPAPEHS